MPTSTHRTAENRMIALPKRIVVAVLVLFWTNFASSEDQPQWGQRHSRNMVSVEKNLPESFDPATGENIKWSAALGSETYSTPVVAGGNWLIGTSYGATLFEIDKQDKVVWKLTPQDVPELGFAYAAAVDLLADGTIVVAAYSSKTPIFAIDKDKKVLWKYDNRQIGAPTNVKVLKLPPR